MPDVLVPEASLEQIAWLLETLVRAQPDPLAAQIVDNSPVLERLDKMARAIEALARREPTVIVPPMPEPDGSMDALLTAVAELRQSLGDLPGEIGKKFNFHVSGAGGGVRPADFPADQLIHGPVTVTSMPEVEIKNDTGNAIPVSGTVGVSNFPADQLVHATNLDLAITALRDALQGAPAGTLEALRALLAGTLSASVTNFPADQLVHATNLDLATTALRDALRGTNSKTISDIVTALASVSVTQGTTPWQVKDDYQTGEVLADQSGAGAVLTFTFGSAVQLVVAESVGTSLTSRADPFGGTPAASTGIRLDDGVPTYIPVVTSSVKVFAPSGTTVSIFGLRRT